jgi:integrase
VTPGKAAKEGPLFNEFADEFMATYVKANNKPSEQMAKECIFRVHLRPRFGTRRLDEVTRRDIEQMKASLLRKGRSAKRINNILSCLSRMLKYAVEVEILDSIPRVQLMKTPPDPFDFLDFDELGQLLGKAMDTDARAAVLCAAHSGLRAGEIRALAWTDVNFPSRVLTVRRTDYRGNLGSPKSGRLRTIPMTDELAAALKAHRHLKGEFVFCDADGQRLSRGALDWILKKVCRRASIRWIKWHGLRHTFCSHLAMKGAPARAIQELAGHASLMTTQRYMHLTPGAGRAAIDLLGQPMDNNATAAGRKCTGIESA